MAKKFFPKALSVGLSLALCATMVAPAFAAMELKDALDVSGNWKSEEERRAAYNEDGSESYYLSEDLELAKSLTIDGDRDVEIDLKGNDLTGPARWQGNFEQNRAVITVDKGADVTVKDSVGTGTISGGRGQIKDFEHNGYNRRNETTGGNVYVDNGSSFTLEGGTIQGGYADFGGNVAAMNGSTVTVKGGSITNGTGSAGGGGVYLNNSTLNVEGSGEIRNNTVDVQYGLPGGGVLADKSFINVSGGKITNNTAAKTEGGGIAASNSTIAVSGGEISNNIADGDGGGGIYAESSNLIISGGKITDNTANDFKGGGIYATLKSYDDSASFVMSGGEITGNQALGNRGEGGGVYLNHVDTTTISGGKLYGNTADRRGDDLVLSFCDTVQLPSAKNMGGELSGKEITNWFADGGTGKTPRWSANGPNTIAGENTKYLKAAHDQYFGVSYYANEEDETPSASFEAEKGFALPDFTVADPEKEGFTFDGWELVNGLDENGKVTGEVKYVAKWTENEQPPQPPYNPGEIEVDEPATPLASGPVTRAEFIDYLWRHEGEPASAGVCTFTDVPADHEFILALAWAEQNGIAEAYFDDAPHVDGTFEPDELVTAGAVREFLGNFETVFGRQAVLALDLTTLAVDDEEAVLNCDEVLAEFFGEEYTSAKDEDIDIAA